MKKDRELIKSYLEKCDSLFFGGKTAVSYWDRIMRDDDLYQEFGEYARKEDYMNAGSVITIVIWLVILKYKTVFDKFKCNSDV